MIGSNDGNLSSAKATNLIFVTIKKAVDEIKLGLSM